MLNLLPTENERDHFREAILTCTKRTVMVRNSEVSWVQKSLKRKKKLARI